MRLTRLPNSDVVCVENDTGSPITLCSISYDFCPTGELDISIVYFCGEAGDLKKVSRLVGKDDWVHEGVFLVHYFDGKDCEPKLDVTIDPYQGLIERIAQKMEAKYG